jgi:hypothetical protein
MILWWGKKKQPDPKTGETPVEPLKPGETPASALDKPVVSLDQQLFGNAPIAAEPDLGDDPLGIRKAAERIAAERAAEAAARDASVLEELAQGRGVVGANRRDREVLEVLFDTNSYATVFAKNVGFRLRKHRRALRRMNKTALLDLGMRLGEGTGAALAAGIVKAAAQLHAGMATFAQARKRDSAWVAALQPRERSRGWSKT